MREIRISKREFCDFCRDYQRAWEAFEKVEGVLGVCLCESEIWKPMDHWYSLIHDLFNFTEEEINSPCGTDLDYFCWDLEFGNRWTPDSIEEDGEMLDWSTPEKFYDWIVAYREKEDEIC